MSINEETKKKEEKFHRKSTSDSASTVLIELIQEIENETTDNKSTKLHLPFSTQCKENVFRNFISFMLLYQVTFTSKDLYKYILLNFEVNHLLDLRMIRIN